MGYPYCHPNSKRTMYRLMYFLYESDLYTNGVGFVFENADIQIQAHIEHGYSLKRRG